MMRSVSSPNSVLVPISVMATRHQRPNERALSHHLHRLQIWRAADQLPRELARFFQQNLDRLAQKLRVKSAPMARDDGLQPLQALGLLRLGNLRFQVGGRRAGTRRIHEGVGGGEADFLHQRERVAKIRLGLARKADDEIRGEREVGARGAQPRDRRRDNPARVCLRFIAASMRSEPDCTGRCT